MVTCLRSRAGQARHKSQPFHQLVSGVISHHIRYFIPWKQVTRSSPQSKKKYYKRHKYKVAEVIWASVEAVCHNDKYSTFCSWKKKQNAVSFFVHLSINIHRECTLCQALEIWGAKQAFSWPSWNRQASVLKIKHLNFYWKRIKCFKQQENPSGASHYFFLNYHAYKSNTDDLLVDMKNYPGLPRS